ncbi:MAG: hypothetical protein ACFE85_13660 [Candidatus Hodarchaeota archaeon]
MIEQIKSKLEELEFKKKQMKPKIDEIEGKRAEEIATVNKKYDHMVYDVNIEVETYETKIINELIELFIRVVMDEFDAKRTISDYVTTEKFIEFREHISGIEIFPKELITRLDKIIDGEPIESLAYDIEKIEKEYKKS